MLESRMHEFCSHQERDSLEGLPDGRQYLGLIAREVGSGVLQVAYEQRNGRVVTGTTEAEVVEESVRLEKLRGEAVRVNVESAYGSYTRDVPDVVDRTGLYIPPSRLEFEIRDTSIATMSKTDRKGWVVRAKSLGTTEVIGTYDPIGSAPQSLGPAPLEVVDEELELTGLELEYQDQSPLLSGKRYIRPGSCFDVSIYGQYRSENLADSRPIGDEATFDVKTSETIRVKSEFPDGRYCVESRGGGAFRVTARGISTRLFRFVVGGRDVIDSVRVEYEGSGPVPVRRREEAPDVACPNLSFTVQYRDETTQDVTIHPASRYKVAFTASRDLQFLLPEYISVGRSANPTDEHPCLRVAGTLSETTIEVPIEAWFGGKRAKTNFPLTR